MKIRVPKALMEKFDGQIAKKELHKCSSFLQSDRKHSFIGFLIP